MTIDEIWILLAAILVGISCALVGTLLVLRRLAMLGDAISHSVLFGLVLAVLLSGGRAPIAMFVGALAAGLLTTFLTNFLSSKAKLQEDASIGVTFTWLFALGVICISLFAGQIDIDQECVLFGELAFLPFETITIADVEIGPRGFYMILAAALINLLVISAAFPRFSLLAFDPLLAQTCGIKHSFWHYLLMAIVSLTTVASFEAVGAILVVALLVIPPNTAYLLARSVREMMLLACLFSTLAALGGFFLAQLVDGSISAAMVIVAGAELIFVLIWQGLRGLRKFEVPLLVEQKLEMPSWAES
jgi:manganese/zinc/iron transport system permease protein